MKVPGYGEDSSQEEALEGCDESSASREDAPDAFDGSEAPEERAELGGLPGAKKRVVRRHKTRDWIRSLPVISEERVAELAARGAAVDGFDDVEGWKNARVMKYRRESPPMSPEVRAVLEALPTFERPADPGVYLLWDRDRVVFVGKSRSGVMGAHLAASLEVGARHRESQVKAFDRLSFLRLPEAALDIAVAALVRLLRPKYNRKPAPRSPEDDAPVLAMLGFAA